LEYLSPALRLVINEPYHQWIDPIIIFIAKAFGCSVALSLQKLLYLFHSSIRGAQLISRFCLLFILSFLFYFILFYFILFYFILFYFILFYFILFYFILFYFILFYFFFILFYFILFYFILFYFLDVNCLFIIYFYYLLFVFCC
jgi:hypothetical protein